MSPLTAGKLADSWSTPAEAAISCACMAPIDERRFELAEDKDETSGCATWRCMSKLDKSAFPKVLLSAADGWCRSAASRPAVL